MRSEERGWGVKAVRSSSSWSYIIFSWASSWAARALADALSAGCVVDADDSSVAAVEGEAEGSTLRLRLRFLPSDISRSVRQPRGEDGGARRERGEGRVWKAEMPVRARSSVISGGVCFMAGRDLSWALTNGRSYNACRGGSVQARCRLVAVLLVSMMCVWKI